MNAITKTSIYRAMAAMFVALALVGSAAAKQEVPFQGSIQGVEIDVPQANGTLSVNGSGTGLATHLGRFTATYEVTVDLSGGVGSFQFIAANGDRVFTELLGQGTPTETPGINRIEEINTITGGTGRFVGATGSFIMERLVDLTTGSTSGSFNGTITSPGAAH
jgi:hypothetical protein